MRYHSPHDDGQDSKLLEFGKYDSTNNDAHENGNVGDQAEQICIGHDIVESGGDLICSRMVKFNSRLPSFHNEKRTKTGMKQDCD